MPGGLRSDPNEEGFAAGVGESVSRENVEVTESTELLLIGPPSDSADEYGEGAFAGVGEEAVAALFRSRLVLVHLFGRAFMGIFFVLTNGDFI